MNRFKTIFFAYAFLASIILPLKTCIAFCEHTNGENSKHIFYLGALGLFVPEYDGAKTYHSPIVVPNFSYNYGKKIIISPYRGIGLNIPHPKPFKLELGTRYKFWFRSKRSKRFVGMSDLKPYWEGYFVVKHRLPPNVPLSFNLGIYHSVSNSKIGGFVKAGFNYFIKLGDSTSLFIGMSTKYSNNNQMKVLYAVSNIVAKSSGLKPFNLGHGFEDIRFNLGVNHAFNHNWNLHIMFSVKRIILKAAKSPIIETKNQLFGNLILNYKFV